MTLSPSNLTKYDTADRTPAYNRRLAKKRVQWLNEALCFISSSVLADSFVVKVPTFL